MPIISEILKAGIPTAKDVNVKLRNDGFLVIEEFDPEYGEANDPDNDFVILTPDQVKSLRFFLNLFP